MSSSAESAHTKVPKYSNKRHQARRLAVQALYQWQLQPCPYPNLIETVTENNQQRYSKSYLETILAGTLQHIDSIDPLLTGASTRKLSQLNPTELAILRLAVFEWLHCKDVPAKVVLNEALELAKEFGAQDGHKYVNAVLHHLLPTLRPNE